MSFLEDLKHKKTKLNKTETIVTKPDGQRYIENGDGVQILTPNYGFIVDMKPDDVPVLITDYLYIGSQDCTTSDVLKAFNIKHVLSVGIDVETNLNHKFVQCLDLPETDIKTMLDESLPFVREAVTRGENVLVHCNAGVSRTAVVAIGYLVHYSGLSYEDAYNVVKEKRPAIQPNPGFKRQLSKMRPTAILEK